VDNLNFKFKAYADDKDIVICVIIDGAQAEFRYTNLESIATLAENMKYIIDYAVEDYTLNKNFKYQIENDLQEWISDES
jgi:hypothetical protein